MRFLWIRVYLVVAKKGTDIGVGVQNGIESVFERKVQLMLALQEGWPRKVQILGLEYKMASRVSLTEKRCN